MVHFPETRVVGILLRIQQRLGRQSFLGKDKLKVYQDPFLTTLNIGEKIDWIEKEVWTSIFFFLTIIYTSSLFHSSGLLKFFSQSTYALQASLLIFLSFSFYLHFTEIHFLLFSLLPPSATDHFYFSLCDL